MSDKKQILEPISAMGRIIMLGYMPISTKFGIDHHRLIIQKSDNNYFNLKQGSVRWFYSYSREQMASLFDPIVRLLFWYFVNRDITEYDEEIDKLNNSGFVDEIDKLDADEVDSEENFLKIKTLPEMKQYLEMFIKGVDKLMETYDSGNTHFTLQYYKILVKSVIKDKFDNDFLPKEYLLKWKAKEGLINVNQIKNLWTPNDLKQLYLFFEQCEQIRENTKSLEDQEKQMYGILKSVDAILCKYENKFYDLIKVSTEG